LRLTIIVPCYNEEQVIRTAHSRLLKVIDGVNWDGEILYVNDGSVDGTGSILREFSSRDSRVSLIAFSRNFGHQAAVSAGIHHCRGDYAAIIDADLQDPPELIPEMLALCLSEKANMVYGRRRSRKGESRFKKWTANLYYRLLNRLSNYPIPLDTGDFRLIDRKVIRAFRSLSERRKYIRGLFAWMGFKQVEFLYDRDARIAGETKYSLAKMMHLGIDGLIAISRRPLSVALSVGLITVIAALFLAIYVFIAYFARQITVIPGWASVTLVIVFFSGVQLLVIGVLGLYLGSLFDEVKGRPEYIIVNDDEK